MPSAFLPALSKLPLSNSSEATLFVSRRLAAPAHLSAGRVSVAAIAVWGTVLCSLPAEPAQAQAQARPAAAKPRLAQAPSSALTVRVERGARVPLPVANVARVVTEDVDVARAAFSNNQAVVEGVSLGSTQMEVQGIDGRVQTVIVEVVEPGSIAASTPAVTNPSPVGTIEGARTEAAVPAASAPAIEPAPIGAPTGIGGATASARAPHALSLRVIPAEDNAQQALVTIAYTNKGAESQDVTVRYALDEPISYVTNSATGSPRYDAAARELSWSVRGVTAGQTRSVSFRVEPSDRRNQAFYSSATVEGADGTDFASNSVKYSFVTTPLLTVFALPDRIIAGRTGPVLVDVRGPEYQNAVDRLQKMGVLNGRQAGLFYPGAPTKRAEYAVMTLKGLNLRDLRDVTAIKFVLGRQSLVNLVIYNSRNQVVATLVRNQSVPAGERTVLWDGRSGSGFAPAGRYRYECTARDVAGETTKLSGIINIVTQAPLRPQGQPSFSDVKSSDWYAPYLALAEKQDLIKGYPGKLFRPARPISRIEATAVVVRALGLEDLARQAQGKDVGFLDEHEIPRWATGYVAVASTVAKSAGGKLIVGYPSNFFLPKKSLRRDEAALIVQRLIDKDANRRISVSGAMVPGAVVTINNRTVEATDDGQFAFVIEQDSANPITLSVTDARR
jgi:hypothetical protein